MAYTKHNFKSGDTLYASQLNEIEDQIALNEEEISGLSETIPEVPESSDPDMYLVTDKDGNRIWEKKLAYVRKEERAIFDGEITIANSNYEAPIQLIELKSGDIIYAIINGTKYETSYGEIVSFNISTGYVSISFTAGLGAPIGILNKTGSEISISMSALVDIYYPVDSKLLPFSAKSGSGVNSLILTPFNENYDAVGIYSVTANIGRTTGSYAFAANRGIANGIYSFAHGQETIASGKNQHVEGIHNIEDTESKYAHIVGNGNSEVPSNAYTLDWEGNGWFASTVKVGGTGQDDTTAQEVALKSDITTLTSTKISFPTTNSTPDHGTAGQFAVSDGNGGITWKTLYEAEEVSY